MEPAPDAKAAADEAPPSAVAGLSRAWLRQTPPFLRGLTLVGDHVAILTEGGVEVRSLRSGARVGQRRACDTFEGALGHVGDDLLLVCRGELQRFAVPSLELITRVLLPGDAEAAAFGGDVVAVALVDGSVHVLRSDDGKVVGALALGVRRPTMAVATTSLAVAQPEGDVGVFALPSGKGSRLGRPHGEAPRALAFAPSGARLILAGRGAARWSLMPAEVTPLPVAADVTQAVWGETSIALATDDGLLVIDPRSGRTESLAHDVGGGAWVGVDVDPTGTHVCAGDRDGRVGCWTRSPRGGDAQLARGSSKLGPRIAARVARAEGRDVNVELATPPGSARPEDQATVRLLRFVATRAGRARGAFWTEVGRGVVRASTPTEITLRLDQEPQPIPGEASPLGRGVAVELLWEE